MTKFAFALISGALVSLSGCREQPHQPAQPASSTPSSQGITPGTPLDLGLHEGSLTTLQLIEKAQAVVRELPAGAQPKQIQTVTEITRYIDLAEQNIASGNEELAHNLASKAYILARDLRRRDK